MCDIDQRAATKFPIQDNNIPLVMIHLSIWNVDPIKNWECHCFEYYHISDIQLVVSTVCHSLHIKNFSLCLWKVTWPNLQVFHKRLVNIRKNLASFHKQYMFYLKEDVSLHNCNTLKTPCIILNRALRHLQKKKKQEWEDKTQPALSVQRVSEVWRMKALVSENF